MQRRNRRLAAVVCLAIGTLVAGGGTMRAQSAALPSPWAAQDIADSWGTPDQFHFVYRPVVGDVDLKMRLASIGNLDRWSEAGVMIRENLSAGAANAFVGLSAQQGNFFNRRPAADTSTVSTTAGSGVGPGWVRLKRTGSLFTAYRSTDGTNWTVIGSDSFAMSDAAFVGIAVSGHNVDFAATAVLDALQITQLLPPDPPPTAVVFQAPAEHAGGVTNYLIEIFAAAADPATATPLAASDIGKPTPAANGDITVDLAGFFGGLAPGTYQLRISAIGPDGKSPSQTVAFTR